jgi:outer membrane protein assembly factor BamB
MRETSRRQLLKGVSGIAAGAVVGTPGRSGRVRRAPGSVLWRAQAGTAARLGTLAVAAGYGMVYASNTPYGKPGRVCAFDSATGARSWQSGSELSQLQTQAAGPAAVFSNANIQSGQSGWAVEIVAWGAATGSALWRFNSGQLSALASYADGMVIVNSYGTLTALDARTGSRAWTSQVPDYFVFEVTDSGAVYASGNVSDGQGEARGWQLAALTTSTGAQRWRLTDGTSVLLGLAAGEGVVCASQFPAHGLSSIFAVDASDGRRLWQAHSNMDLGVQTISGGVVIGSDILGPVSGPTLYARHVTSGAPAWHRTLADNAMLLTADSEVLYAGGGPDNPITALAASTGKTLWTSRIGAYAVAAAVNEGVLYVIDANATVYAIQG